MRIGIGLGTEKKDEKHLLRQGVSRRDFLQFCTAVAVSMGMGPSFAPKVAMALTNRRASVVYLHGAECTGCTESLLRSYKPYIDTLILDTISLDYNETIMAAAGEAAEDALRKAVGNPDGFICIVEGAVPTALNGIYGHIGGHTILDVFSRVLPKAGTVIAYGTCAAYGGVQAASPNPTGAKGVGACFSARGVKPVNIPGCPPNPLNIVGTLVAFLEGKTLELDDAGRPLMFYSESVHEQCERLPRYEAGQFAPSFDSEEARRGWCLYELGCKGTYTKNNCPTARFNDANWPVGAGHPCIGCSEPGFWDHASPFYRSGISRFHNRINAAGYNAATEKS
jgi:[NiFe] hydrogenase small subunit